MGYRDVVVASSPVSYWRLGTSVAPPTTGGFDTFDGLILGEGPSVDGLQGDWQNWSWQSALDFHFETGSRAHRTDDILDLTIGPFGTKWQPDAGASDVGFQLHTDAGVDWAAGAVPYTHLSFCIKWDGSGPTPLVDCWLNVSTGGVNSSSTRISVTAGGTNIYPFPKNSQMMWRYDIKLTGAATLGSLGTFGLTAGSIIHEIVFQNNGLSPTSPFYIDEIQLVRTKAAANVYSIADTTEDAQTYNWVPNHMVLLNKPSPPSWSNWNVAPLLAYWNAMDGNFTADATWTILKVAAQKWGYGSSAPVVVAGSDNGAALNVPNLLAAISSHESSWRQDIRSDWQQWRDPQTGVFAIPWCYCTFGIGQDKVQDHPPYPHARLSTAWAAELHAMTIRQHYAGLGGAAGGPFPSTNNLRRSLAVWYYGPVNGTASTYDGTDAANSFYTCVTIGGTVNEPSNAYHGQTFDPTNPAAPLPSYMALAKWANPALKNTGYWQY